MQRREKNTLFVRISIPLSKAAIATLQTTVRPQATI